MLEYVARRSGRQLKFPDFVPAETGKSLTIFRRYEIVGFSLTNWFSCFTWRAREADFDNFRLSNIDLTWLIFTVVHSMTCEICQGYGYTNVCSISFFFRCIFRCLTIISWISSLISFNSFVKWSRILLSTCARSCGVSSVWTPPYAAPGGWGCQLKSQNQWVSTTSRSATHVYLKTYQKSTSRVLWHFWRVKSNLLLG